MPRNASGTYTLPVAAFTAGQLITAEDENSNNSDIAQALTTSLATTGVSSMTGPVKGFDGAVTAPSYTFAADTDTGFWRNGSGQIGWSANGVQGALFNSDLSVTWAGAASWAGAATFNGIATFNANVTFNAVPSFSGTAGVVIPVGTTAQRPGSPAQGTIRFNSTLGQLENYTGSVWVQLNTPASLGAPYNIAIAASVNANVLTIAVKAANNGNDLSAQNPGYMTFQHLTAGVADGGISLVGITAALSISTVVGGTIGALPGSIPFRLWVVAVDNNGSVALCLINCTQYTAVNAPINIFPLDEGKVISATQMSAAADNSGVFYSNSGTTVTSRAFRILGYVDYDSGLVTAGTFNNAPTRTVMFGPGVHKPGDIVRTFAMTDNTETLSAGGVQTATATTITATLTSVINAVFVQASGCLQCGAANQVYALLYRGAAAVNFGSLVPMFLATNNIPCTLSGMDKPFALSATYTVYIENFSAGNCRWNNNTVGAGALQPIASMLVQEIMG